LLEWVQQILANYSFDALRLDTVPEIEPGFWADLQSAAGCYCVGEVWSSIQCSQAYQAKAIDGTLAYPMFEVLRDVFQNGHDMSELSAQFWLNLNYEDPDALGTFIDNHDNARFLNSGNSANNILQYKNAITWTLTAQGIPIIYYGTEQLFNGGNDPNNREVLWTSKYNKNADMYGFLADVISVRKQMSVWDSPQVERYKAGNFYAYTRGNTLICLTNQPQGSVSYTITYHPYNNGQRLCNFLSNGDCLTVNNNQFTVTLMGLPKIYIPS